MSTTPNMSLVLPTDHASTDVWGAAINTAMGLVDAHDHSPGKGVKISQAGIGITGDLTFVSHAATNMSVLDLIPVTTTIASAYSSALFTNSADNNLYWRTNLGTNVQITNGGTLNFSVTGGFGGDYSSAGALADFIDANDTYHFYQQLGGGVRQYARVAMADLDLFEYKANPATGVPTNRVRQKSPAALAASYDLTWLAALPAANQLVSIDNTGAITAGTTTALAANSNLTLSGTGVVTAPSFNHTAIKTMSIPYIGGATTSATAGIGGVTTSAASWSWISGIIPLIVNDIWQSVFINFKGVSGQTYTFKAIKYNSGGILATLDTWTQNGTGASSSVSHSLASPYTMTAGDHIYVEVDAPAGGSAADNITDARVTWTHPA